MNIPINQKLYDKVKNEAKKRFTVWPSAYASGWLVREYKRRGGTYAGKKKDTEGLSRWFKEKWIDTCKLPAKKPCGRPSRSGSLTEWRKKYPYCRPSVRVSSQTPKTYSELGSNSIKRLCKKKRQSPEKRMKSQRLRK